MDGAAIAPHLLALGRQAPHSESLRGHFTALLGVEDELVAFTDWMGVASLYEVRAAGRVYLSNRVDLLARLLCRFHRDEARFDHASWAQGLISEGRFGRTHTSTHLYLEGLSWYRPDEMASIRGAQVERVRRYRLEDIQPDREAYAAYLRQAAVEIRENLEAALSAPQFAHRVLMLSGGFDSRLILAGLVSLGRQDEIHAASWAGHDAADPVLASALVKAFNLKPTRIDAARPQSHERSLEIWTSLNMGLGNQFRPLHGPVATAETTWMARLVGGGGESLRAHISKVAAAALGPDEPCPPTRPLLTRMIQALGEECVASREGVALAIDRHAQSIDALPGADPLTRLDFTQFYHKARVFFGDLALCAFAHHPYLIMPLFAPGAVKAGLAAAPAHRFAGGLVFDLFMQLCPPLAYMPFAHGAWSAGAVDGAPSARFLQSDAIRLPADAGIMAGAPLLRPAPGPPPPDTGVAVADVNAWMAGRIRPALDAALEDPDWGPLVAADRARRRLDFVARKRPAYLAVWTSRLAALGHYRRLLSEGGT